MTGRCPTCGGVLPSPSLTARRQEAEARRQARAVRRQAQERREQAVLALRRTGLTYRAIGEALGVSAPRVRQLAIRAERRERMAQRLDGRGGLGVVE